MITRHHSWNWKKIDMVSKDLINQYPETGFYCPAREGHQERRERLLAAFSNDSLFLHCSEHDWIRIELFKFGKRINLKGITAIASQVKPIDGDRIIFELEPIPIHARGKFQVKRRKWREGLPGPSKNYGDADV